MPQKATYPMGADPPALDPAQLVALEQLVTGETVVSAATAAGVCRETVHRWLRSNIVFRSELNRLRSDLRDDTERRLLAVAQQAATSLSGAIADGNVAAALAVLKGLGFLSGARPAVGPTDAAVLAEDDALVAAERERNRTLRAMLSASL